MVGVRGDDAEDEWDGSRCGKAATNHLKRPEGKSNV